ncbi:MAG: DUF1365 domain-containing protein [Planctomycetota bacterium]|nr:DUF1365 domain-containing protein [Planctomycetota bacterium]
MTHSAIYTGHVFHNRTEPRPHAFRYRLFMLYLDLDELATVFRGRWLWSIERWNVCSFKRADYLGPTDVPLKKAVLDRVQAHIGRRPTGAVRMLTHLRTFGYVFNPVTFYYCFDADEKLVAVASEITNTPWGERHTYVLAAHEASEKQRISSRFPKEFHISPFQAMEVDHDWRFDAPGDRLGVAMTNLEAGRPIFHAGLSCKKQPITSASLAGALIRYPFLTAVVHAAIYWQAVRLWLKRAPFHTHPTKRSTEPNTHTT